jgi:hypothetical protein
MELVAKIIFFTGAWYAIGVLGMMYIRYWFNKGIEPTSPQYDHVTGREVFTLAILGLGIIIFIAIAELHYRLTGKG